jgi:hypothetical protein
VNLPPPRQPPRPPPRPKPNVRAPFFEFLPSMYRAKPRCQLCRKRPEHVLSVGPFAICEGCLEELDRALGTGA